MDLTKLFKEASEAVDGINEILAKSMPLRKEEENPEMEAGAPPAPEMPGSEEQPAEDLAAQAGDEAQDADQAVDGEDEMSLEQHAESMSDEELHEFVEVLMKELEKRHGAEQAPESPEAPAMDAPPAPEMEKSSEMKDSYAKMHKSLDKVASVLDKVSQRLDKVEESLTKSAKPVAPAKSAVPAVKAPASNSEVLTKSAPKAQRLTKSETANFLVGRVQNGDRLVSSDDIVKLNFIKSEEDLWDFQDRMIKNGVQFPKL